ncbi:hypothetical protein DSO57_1011231 [Entomophthora muscae]|uniref:Uncharacterized protein n=1 Tax=Entomophthora muscae TaxID=34485 RepID=A0ACC2S8C2_9FUNG|nr:hypothetical protein DSO57_1011231 [Entomophthora muscae]
MMFYPVQDLDYYRDVNNAPFIQDGPPQVHSNYALRSDLASAIAWVIHSGDVQAKEKMRRSIKITYLLRLLLLISITSLICVGLQLILGAFSAYIFLGSDCCTSFGL